MGMFSTMEKFQDHTISPRKGMFMDTFMLKNLFVTLLIYRFKVTLKAELL